MFSNFTKDEQQSVILITILTFFAIISFTGAALLVPNYFLIASLLFLSGLFLAGIAISGYVLEFAKKKDE
jgi:hypothetical protein